MSSQPPPVVPLSEMTPGQEADLFALLTFKEELLAKNGRPYFRVGFRDAAREVAFPIWDNSPWAVPCRDQWQPGTYYKLRATYRETNFGPQLDIRKIREVTEADAADGFDPGMCLPRSRFDPQAMLAELEGIVQERIADAGLRSLVESIIGGNRRQLAECPAARRNHHALPGRAGGAHVERYPNLHPPGRQVRRLLPPTNNRP